MEDNQLWKILNEEVDKTLKAIDELMNDLVEEYYLVTIEERKEELLLRKYWLLFLQDRLKKIVKKGRRAGIIYRQELKQKIKSAIDDDNFEGFNYFDTWSQTNF